MTLLEPEPVWRWVARRRKQRGISPLRLGTAALGGLVVAGFTEIGVRHFTTDWNLVAGYSVERGRGWQSFALLWLMAATLPLAQGLAGAWLLPLYGCKRDWVGGAAVGVLGSLPIYAVAPSLIVLPGILLVCVAFLVSCAWWGSGARDVLGLPLGESTEHVVVSIVLGSVALSIVSAALPFA